MDNADNEENWADEGVVSCACLIVYNLKKVPFGKCGRQNINHIDNL